MEVETPNNVVPQNHVEKVLSMGTGDGEESYSKNSDLQGSFNQIPQLALKDALEKVTLPSVSPVVVADLGSSSGPNAIDNVALIVDKLRLRLPEDAEVQAFFNDLPSNDFNNLFQLLTNDSRAKNLFAAGAPGSFYGRLFAESSVHVFHSSLSVHWLSKIPDAVQDKDSPAYNKGNIGIFHSRSAVAKAFQEQASQDLKKFLDARAAELAPGGLLFFTSPGRLSSELTKPKHDSWVEFTVDLNETWNALVAKGFLTEEQLDTFNLPCYMRSIEDVQEAIASCGSLFDVLTTKLHSFDRGLRNAYDSASSDPEVVSKKIGMAYKAVMNVVVEAHVGKEAAELIWHRYLELLEKRMKIQGTKLPPMYIVALIRK